MLLLQAEREVKNYLRKNPGCRFIDIVRGTGKSRGIVHRCLQELSKREELEGICEQCPWTCLSL